MKRVQQQWPLPPIFGALTSKLIVPNSSILVSLFPSLYEKGWFTFLHLHIQQYRRRLNWRQSRLGPGQSRGFQAKPGRAQHYATYASGELQLWSMDRTKDLHRFQSRYDSESNDRSPRKTDLGALCREIIGRKIRGQRHLKPPKGVWQCGHCGKVFFLKSLWYWFK